MRWRKGTILAAAVSRYWALAVDPAMSSMKRETGSKGNRAFRRGGLHYRYAESNGIRVMSMPALVVNEKVVAMGKVLKAADVVALLHKLGF